MENPHHAGKRQGLADERDTLAVTVALIELMRPRAYLIGNIPGLEGAMVEVRA